MTLILRNGHRQDIDPTTKELGLKMYSKRMVAGYIIRPEPGLQMVEIGGTGAHGIKCTCIERDFPCPFHFRDYERNQ